MTTDRFRRDSMLYECHITCQRFENDRIIIIHQERVDRKMALSLLLGPTSTLDLIVVCIYDHQCLIVCDTSLVLPYKMSRIDIRCMFLDIESFSNWHFLFEFASHRLTTVEVGHTSVERRSAGRTSLARCAVSFVAAE